jgi:hypothetical protein
MLKSIVSQIQLGEQLKNLSCFIFFVFFASISIGQPAKPMTRWSSLDFKLDNKELKPIIVMADSADSITIEIKTKGPVNVLVQDPNGTIRAGEMILGRSFSMLEFGGVTGAWQVSVENLLSFSKSKVHMSLATSVDSFVFGSGLSTNETVLNERKQEIMVQGLFRIKKANPLSFSVSALKGDTIRLNVIPESGVCPQLSITNDAGEWLFSSLPARAEAVVEIPMLMDGSCNVTIDRTLWFGIVPKSLKQVFTLDISKVTPRRYALPSADPEEATEQENDIDTVAEVYLDTTISLGAVRDILNSSEQEIIIEFDKPEAILSWVIVFGSGPKFMKEMKLLDDYPSIDPSSGLPVDPLVSFSRHELRSLPRTSNDQVAFVTSADISDALEGNNWGEVHSFSDRSRLKVVNKSKSVGQSSLVRIVTFRTVQK